VLRIPGLPLYGHRRDGAQVRDACVGYALIAAIAFLCENETAYQSRKLGLIVGVFHQGPVTPGRVGVG
jgi:hypothetical protein